MDRYLVVRVAFPIPQGMEGEAFDFNKKVDD